MTTRVLRHAASLAPPTLTRDMVSIHGMLPYERDVYRDHAWWTPSEMLACGEVFSAGLACAGPFFAAIYRTSQRLFCDAKLGLLTRHPGGHLAA